VTDRFFEEREDQSAVKAEIIQKYFSRWAKIILPTARRYYQGRIAYIDLYAGPGRYKDGSASTPLLILQEAIEDDAIAESLITYFNDIDVNNVSTLQREIALLPGIEKLKHKPVVTCDTVDEDAEEYYLKNKLPPTFTFLDPFGYKGISLRLLRGLIKDWGCDCVLFFNYNRISPGLSNPAVRNHMFNLFGEERARALELRVGGTNPHLREQVILEELNKALLEIGVPFVLTFQFRNETGRPTHHLVFLSKSFTGYEAMKDVMASASSKRDQGVPALAYCPADNSMPLLFELTRPLDDLEGMLRKHYAGKTLSMLEIYRLHSVGRPYLSRHYKEVLKNMELNNQITVRDPRGKTRRRGSFADELTVSFPSAF